MSATEDSELDLADDSEKLLPLVTAAMRVLLGPESAEAASNCHELADFLGARGQTQVAGLLYERALAIKQQSLGPEHPDVAVTLHNLALLRQAEGNFDEANRLWGRARVAFETSP